MAALIEMNKEFFFSNKYKKTSEHKIEKNTILMRNCYFNPVKMI